MFGRKGLRIAEVSIDGELQMHKTIPKTRRKVLTLRGFLKDIGSNNFKVLFKVLLLFVRISLYHGPNIEVAVGDC